MRSGLHSEFYDMPERVGIRDDVDCDVAVVADDIHVETRGIDWAAHTFERPCFMYSATTSSTGKTTPRWYTLHVKPPPRIRTCCSSKTMRSPPRTFCFWARHCGRAWNPRITP